MGFQPPPESNSCKGIQSKRLASNSSIEIARYCYGLGWFQYSDLQWHAKGCTTNDKPVDKYNRCTKCKSVYNNMNCTNYPVLFNYNPQEVTSLIPKDSAIEDIIAKRLLTIAHSDVSTDTILHQAAALLTLNGSYNIDIGNNDAFLICQECTAYRVCRKRSDNGTLCTSCKKKKYRKTFSRLEDRITLNKEHHH